MTTPKFTPGPWATYDPLRTNEPHQVLNEDGTLRFTYLSHYVKGPDGKVLATVSSYDTPHSAPMEQFEGNCKLIAVAPEMWGLLSRVAAGEDVRNEAETLLNGLNA